MMTKKVKIVLKHIVLAHPDPVAGCNSLQWI